MKRHPLLAWAYCLPAMVAIALVAGWPLARTVMLSFTDATLDQPGIFAWVGLDNFIMLFEDPDWHRVIANTFVFAGLSVTLEAIFGTLVALVLNSRFPGRAYLRAVVLVPWAIPTVVSAKMWSWMFHDLYGVVNEMLLAVGMIHDRVTWLVDPIITMGVIVLVDVWKTTPFVALMVLAALQSIPKNVLEAAKLDGVPPVRLFFDVILPFIRPALLVAITFRVLDALRIFDLIYVLTSNSVSTASMSVYARQQLFDFQDVGYGSAASTSIFLMIAVVAFFILRANRKHMEATF